MENVWITLITVAGGLIATLISFLIKVHNDKKQAIKEQEKYKEMLNYIFGQVDMIIQDSIKVEPEIREAMKKASRRYHRLDLVKAEPKENKENDNKKEVK